MTLRRLVPIIICALATAACGDALSGVGDLSERIVHGDPTVPPVTTTVAAGGSGVSLTGVTGDLVWTNDGVGAPVGGLTAEQVIQQVWLRSDGVNPYVQSSREEIAAALSGVEFPRLIPSSVTHVSSQLVFDQQTGTLGVSAAAAFGLWSAEPYSVPRSEGQLVVLWVGLVTGGGSGDEGISSFWDAEGRQLTWASGPYEYTLFCRTGISEDACFTMAESMSELSIFVHLTSSETTTSLP
jgi:hypothetical protein